MNKSKIFISYSHKDEDWKNRLVKHLKVLEPEGRYQLWDDSKIGLGSDWLQGIEKAMNDADAAIMMVSADFLTSGFILTKEVPDLMERRQKEGFIVIPFIVKPCAWDKVSWLSPIQAAPKGGTPLIEGGEFEIEKKLADFARNLFDLLGGDEKTIRAPGKAGGTILLTDIPQREIDLIGRTEELQMLRDRLKEAKRLLLLNGLGGVGKTEVCKRFFLDSYKQFSFAGWIDYVSSIKESIVTGIKTNKVELNEGDTLDERFEKIMEFLKTLDEDSLLVIDNIEDPKDEHLGTIKTLPFKVIANSRLHLEGFEVHTLDFLSAQSCKDLFCTFYTCERDDIYVEKIIELCNKHTLTVELLARTAQNAAMPVKALYETLEKKGFNLNEVIGDNVHTFWHNEKKRKRFFNHLLTLFDLYKVKKAERHILVNLAVLPAIDIPVSDFSDWLGLKSKEAINSLVRKGWLRKRGFMIFMHQVIQEVIRYKVTPGVKECKDLMRSINNKLYYEPGENPLDKKEFIIFAESLLHHIDEDDKNLATLANNLSLIYQDLGQMEKALEFQLKALNIREEVLAKNHPSLATSYNNLSMIYQDLGQMEKALEFQLKTVEIFEEILAKNHPSLATSYNNLSMIYKALGQMEKALEFQLKDVKISEEILAKNHPSLATSYNNLSLIYKALGQMEKALEFQLKTVEIFEKILAKNHPSLATSYNNIALIYKDLKDYKKAVQYAQQAVAILQHLFPNGHPNLDKAKKNLEIIKEEMK